MAKEQWKKNMVYVVVSGSHSHGLSTPESDVDTRGIYLPGREYILGTQRASLIEDKESDTVIYPITKFFELLMKNNPSVLELLYIENPKCILLMEEPARKIRENRDLFLSTKVSHTYSGYAHAQLKKMRRHREWLLNPPTHKPTRKEFDLPENKGTLTSEEQESFLWLVNNLIKDTVEESRLNDETKAALNELNIHGCLQSNIKDEAWKVIRDFTGVSDNFIYAMQRERAYKNKLNQWKSYQHWLKTRNPKRAELENKCQFDSKNASHLIRLMRMGYEILSGKGVIVERPDREELLSIKQGNWKYEDVLKYAEELEQKLLEAKKTTTLPRQPQRKKIEELLIEIQEEHLWRSKKC